MRSDLKERCYEKSNRILNKSDLDSHVEGNQYVVSFSIDRRRVVWMQGCVRRIEEPLRV